jgi:membrane protein DedA with SNARE-associated domain
MSFESIIITYGYWALLLGTFLEGETITIISGFLARRGYLHLPFVIGISFLGTMLGDQTFFFIGRFKGRAFLVKRPAWLKKKVIVDKYLNKYSTIAIILFRFVYGTRTITPFVIGMSSITTLRFVILNMLGAFVWAVTFGTAGYVFGTALELLIRDIKRYEIGVLIAFCIVIIMIWLIHFTRSKRNPLESV